MFNIPGPPSPFVLFHSSGSFGFEFTPIPGLYGPQNVYATELGFLDLGTLQSNHHVGLYDSSGNLLASTWIFGEWGDLDRSFYYRKISPVLLVQGQKYFVVGTSDGTDPSAGMGDRTFFSSPSCLYCGENTSFLGGVYTWSNTTLQFPEAGVDAGIPLGYFGATLQTNSSLPPVPEPAPFLLLGTGMASVFATARRHLRAKKSGDVIAA